MWLCGCVFSVSVGVQRVGAWSFVGSACVCARPCVRGVVWVTVTCANVSCVVCWSVAVRCGGVHVCVRARMCGHVRVACMWMSGIVCVHVWACVGYVCARACVHVDVRDCVCFCVFERE